MIFISKRTHPFLEPVFLWTLFHTTHRDHRVIVGLPSWESDLAAWNWAPVAAPASCQSSRRARWWPTNKKKHRIWLYHIIWKKKKKTVKTWLYIYTWDFSRFQRPTTWDVIGFHGFCSKKKWSFQWGSCWAGPCDWLLRGQSLQGKSTDELRYYLVGGWPTNQWLIYC